MNLKIEKYLNRKKRKIKISKLIKKIWSDSNKIYGARKIKSKLELSGIYVSERTVGNYMKDMDIASVYRRKYRPSASTKTKRSDLSKYIKDTPIDRPHHAVATDITYIDTLKDGGIYQITFIDLHTRKILHYAVSRKMNDEFVSINTEIVLQKYKDICVIHSNRGSQYTSNSYRNLLKRYNVASSYSKPGYPYDNAIIESYHASLKIEWIYRQKFQSNHLKKVKQIVSKFLTAQHITPD